jgi:hypothetical protein
VKNIDAPKSIFPLPHSCLGVPRPNVDAIHDLRPVIRPSRDSRLFPSKPGISKISLLNRGLFAKSMRQINQLRANSRRSVKREFAPA